MTPAEAARAVADDYDLVGTQDAEWMAMAWRRFAEKLDPSTEQENYGVVDES